MALLRRAALILFLSLPTFAFYLSFVFFLVLRILLHSSYLHFLAFRSKYFPSVLLSPALFAQQFFLSPTSGRRKPCGLLFVLRIDFPRIAAPAIRSPHLSNPLQVLLKASVPLKSLRQIW